MQTEVSPTFAAREICQSLGIPHGTLNSWHHQGFLRNLDCSRTIPGRARLYTRGDAVALGLVKAVSDLGLPIAAIAENARAVAGAYISGPDLEDGAFLVLHLKQGGSASVDFPCHSAPQAATACVVVNVRDLLKAVVKSLPK